MEWVYSQGIQETRKIEEEEEEMMKQMVQINRREDGDEDIDGLPGRNHQPAPEKSPTQVQAQANLKGAAAGWKAESFESFSLNMGVDQVWSPFFYKL